MLNVSDLVLVTVSCEKVSGATSGYGFILAQVRNYLQHKLCENKFRMLGICQYHRDYD